MEYVTARHDPSWIRPAILELADAGMLRGTRYMGHDPIYELSGAGLTRAAELLAALGQDLYALAGIKKAGRSRETEQEPASFSQTNSPVWSAQEGGGAYSAKMQTILRLSDASKSLNVHIQATLEDLRTSNRLPAENSPAFSQHYHELEAASGLLKAEQVDLDLLKYILLAALRWFHEKVGEDHIRAQIKRLIEMTESLVGE
ncbi:hypothetical protein [Sinorhizobium sp. RAC02]|uniref:hypothetical protein n=1 Tax=Sinorhizobium sp. RAC02 TaxID=1842534 RepID=UPI00083E4759|nr:hypothetical protein [Sinorhizobium sp. RAC02]AOF91194.1 hypothetical protein BSY16_2013 [Sinorhizobium sp. RAC02]